MMGGVMNFDGVVRPYGLAIARQLMLRWPTIGLIAILIVGGGLICWLYVAQVAKNLETSKAAPSGTEQVTAVQQRDSGQARKAAADLPSAIAALNQGLHELAAGLDQVKQELQRERERSVKETHQLAADLAQMQQSVLPKSEQARLLTEELAANMGQLRQALEQQGDRAEKLALESPRRDLIALEQEGERAGRLNALASDVAQLKQAFGVLSADLDKVTQAIPQDGEKSERKIASLATALADAKQAAQREREAADRRAQELTADLAQLKEAFQRENDTNGKLAGNWSADVALIKKALRHEREQRVQMAHELTTSLAQLKMTVRELTADLAKAKQPAQQGGDKSETQAHQPATELLVTNQSPMPPSRGPEELLATRSDAMADGDRNRSALQENAKFLPAPAHERNRPGERHQPAQTSADVGDAELQRLMSRARLLLSQGDIGAARGVLEHAAERGNAEALFALAETFDPVVLSAWGTRGTQGDAPRAQELYARALAGGVQEAKSRLTR